MIWLITLGINMNASHLEGLTGELLHKQQKVKEKPVST